MLSHGRGVDLFSVTGGQGWGEQEHVAGGRFWPSIKENFLQVRWSDTGIGCCMNQKTLATEVLRGAG